MPAWPRMRAPRGSPTMALGFTNPEDGPQELPGHLRVHHRAGLDELVQAGHLPQSVPHVPLVEQQQAHRFGVDGELVILWSGQSAIDRIKPVNCAQAVVVVYLREEAAPILITCTLNTSKKSPYAL